jgi:hypothetical protein
MNSSKRDLKSYPNGNVYSLDLLTPLKNITKVELMSARVPNTIYNITNGSGAFSFTSASLNDTISLPPGFWSDPDDLATELYKRFPNVTTTSTAPTYLNITDGNGTNCITFVNSSANPTTHSISLPHGLWTPTDLASNVFARLPTSGATNLHITEVTWLPDESRFIFLSDAAGAGPTTYTVTFNTAEVAALFGFTRGVPYSFVAYPAAGQAQDLVGIFTCKFYLKSPYISAPILTEVTTSIAVLSIKWLPSEGLYIIYSNQTDPITITVNSSDLARLLGFPVGTPITMLPYPQTTGRPQDLIGILPLGTQQYIKSTTVADFSKNDYIFVDVQEFRNMGLNELSSLPLSGKTTTNMFTALTLDVPANSVKIHKNSDYPVVVEYDPPISKITRLTIGWYDSDANLINFQGLEDNVLMFRVTTKPDVQVTEIDELQTPDDMLYYDSRPPVQIPKPPEVREKRVLGKWFFYLGIIGLLVLWFIRRRSSLPGRF